MGARANFIILENNTPKIFYAIWDAPDVPRIMAQGLEFCENYFRKQYESGFLMDNAFAEGGILIDKDKKTVFLFNEEEFIPAICRLYLRIVQMFLDGWKL